MQNVMKRNPLHLHVLALVWSLTSLNASADEIRPTDPPCPTLSTSDITSPSDGHRVRLLFPALLDLDPASLGDADLILLGAHGFEERARFEGYAREVLPIPLTTTSLPTDNEPIRIPAPAPAPVIVAQNDEGRWLANVELISGPGEQIVVDAWGPLVVHGHSFVALATVHIEAVNGPVEPIAHSYDLGPLQPGYYAFFFKSNLAHCDLSDFTVPGVEGTPVARWQALIGSAPDDSRRLGKPLPLPPRRCRR
jgi:hypothetical protein